jgi:hypothetical protein
MINLETTVGDILTPYSKRRTVTHKTIQLPKSLSVIDEFGNRRNVFFLTEGQKLLVSESNELCPLNEDSPTHQITHCWTENYESLGITICNLKTRELTKIYF